MPGLVNNITGLPSLALISGEPYSISSFATESFRRITCIECIRQPVSCSLNNKEAMKWTGFRSVSAQLRCIAPR